MNMMSLAASGIQFPDPVEAYLDALVHTSAEDLPTFVSLVLFGSAAKGGFSGNVSDVDVIIVVPDAASRT
jgi:predicted nucleotidyltransferase